MSGLAETSPNTSRARVTHVRAIIDATALSVRIADNTCCAEFATHTGLVRVLLPADRFVSAARAERDGNGKPFPPTRADTRSEANLRVLEEDAAVVPVVVHPRRVVMPSGEGAEKCALAWERLKSDPTLTAGDAARAAGVSRSYFANYLKRHHPEEYEAAKAAGAASRQRSRGVREKLIAAWDMLRTNERMQVQDAAASQGLVPTALSTFINANYREEWAEMKLARRRARIEAKRITRENRRPGRPILKPKGTIL